MLIVSTDAAAVETALAGGLLVCPACGVGLSPWGHSVWREVRLVGRAERRRLRRTVCRTCSTTHVLMPDDMLLRRRDGVEVVGAALTQKAQGKGHRPIAVVLGRPASTVRGWLRRFAAMAGELREHFTRWAHSIDPSHDRLFAGGSALCDAVEAVGVLGMVAVRRFGPRPPWPLASLVTGGGLLCNTSSPWARPV